MSGRRILITGSADGLGLDAARKLIAGGHAVTLHARSEARAQEALAAAPGAAGALHGDLGSLAQTRALADAANAAGPFEAVVHNAGIYREPRRVATEDGLPRVLQVNVLAPYLLTALIAPPQRLVYLTSGLGRSGTPDLDDLRWERRGWDWMEAYSDSKLWIAALALAVARRWPGVASNAVNPGWVPTKMGGAGAPDDRDLGSDTQVWLAADDDPDALASGRILFHREAQDAHPAASDPVVQDAFLAACAELTGESLPGGR